MPQLVERLSAKLSDGKIPRWLKPMLAHAMDGNSDEQVAPVLAQVIEIMEEVLHEYESEQVLAAMPQLEMEDAFPLYEHEQGYVDDLPNGDASDI